MINMNVNNLNAKHINLWVIIQNYNNKNRIKKYNFLRI